MRSKILLALPTALYAPIYLAKHLTLSKEFAHIDFEYPKESQLNKKDELIDKLLNKFDATDALLAVVDPIRILFANKDPTTHNKPLVLKSLIQKMCYWKIGYYPENRENTINNRYKLITHPKGMTGHTIAKHDLLRFQNNGERDDELINAIDDNLFHKIYPSEERIWYNHRGLAFPCLKIGVVTLNPLLAFKSVNEQHLDVKCFFKQEEYKNVIMTALVTSEEIYKHKKEIIDDLIGGIQKAIQFIREDPLTASQKLLEYSDDKFRPEAIGWNELYMFKLFSEVINEEGIYNESMEITKDAVNRSKEIWKKVIDNEKDESLRKQIEKELEPDIVEKYFDYSPSFYIKPFYFESTFSRFRSFNKKHLGIRLKWHSWLDISFWVAMLIGSLWMADIIVKIVSFKLKDDPDYYENLFSNNRIGHFLFFDLVKNLLIEQCAALLIFILLFTSILHIFLEIRSLTAFKSIFSVIFFSWSLYILLKGISYVHHTDQLNHMSVEIFSAIFIGILIPLIFYNRTFKIKIAPLRYMKRSFSILFNYLKWQCYNLGRIIKGSLKFFLAKWKNHQTN